MSMQILYDFLLLKGGGLELALACDLRITGKINLENYFKILD